MKIVRHVIGSVELGVLIDSIARSCREVFIGIDQRLPHLEADPWLELATQIVYCVESRF